MDNLGKMFNNDLNSDGSSQNVSYKNVHVSLDTSHCKLRIFKDVSLKMLLRQIDLHSAVFKFVPNVGDGLCGFELFDVNLGYRFTCSDEGEAEKWLIILQCMRNSANMNSVQEMNATQTSIMSVVIYEKKYELTQLNCFPSENNCDREIALQKQMFHLSNELFYLQELLVKYRQRELRSVEEKVKYSIPIEEVLQIVDNEIALPPQFDENTTLESEEDRSQIVKWENLIADNYEPSEKVKEMIRDGIPEAMRRTVWNYCINKKVCSIKGSQTSNYYQICLDKCHQTHNLASKQIELDLLRSIPEMDCYSNIECEKIQELRNVLQAFAIHRQDIGYCQGMNRLVAVALLTLTEEEAFWCLIAIIEKMPASYFSYNLIGAQADQRVFFELFSRKCPKLSRHLNQYDVDITLFTFNWFLTIFVDCGYDKFYYRVWDCFLNEGSKILFRFAIGLLKLNQEQILALNDSIQIHKFLQSLPGKKIDLNLLSYIAFHDIKNFSMKTIYEKRCRLTQQLYKEFAILESKREIMRGQRLTIGHYDDDDDDDDDDDEEDHTDDKDLTEEKKLNL